MTKRNTRRVNRNRNTRNRRVTRNKRVTRKRKVTRKRNTHYHRKRTTLKSRMRGGGLPDGSGQWKRLDEVKPDEYVIVRTIEGEGTPAESDRVLDLTKERAAAEAQSANIFPNGFTLTYNNDKSHSVNHNATGTYKREGSHNGFPLYKKTVGGVWWMYYIILNAEQSKFSEKIGEATHYWGLTDNEENISKNVTSLFARSSSSNVIPEGTHSNWEEFYMEDLGQDGRILTQRFVKSVSIVAN